MRNLKRVLSLTLASVMLLGMMVVGSSAAGYPDVDAEDNVEAIEVVQAVGIMVGDENGNFNPDNQVTRVQMAVIMANLLDLNTYLPGNHPFNDVPSWAEASVSACYTRGVISGYGDGRFGTDDPVTAVQAASMLMRALGYFQFPNDVADGFELATIRQAGKIDLFSNVGTSSANDYLTRNQVAQLVLNALKSGTVEPDSNALSIITPDGYTVAQGQTNYVYVVGRDVAVANAINTTRADSGHGSNGLTGPILDLGEKRYNGKLKLDDNAIDAFGRPARYWEYDGKEVGTYAKKELLVQEYVGTVTGKDLYDLLSATTIADYGFNLAIDGVTEKSIDSNIFVAGDMNKNNKDTLGGTGTGVITQVYVDNSSDSVRKGQIYIAIINTYLAIASKDYDEKTEEVPVTIYAVSKPAGSGEFVKTRNKDKEDKVTSVKIASEDLAIALNVKKDDALLVTLAEGAVQTAVPAEVLAGVQISAFKVGSNVTVDGTQYDFTTTAEYKYGDLDVYTGNSGTINLKDLTYNVYLDAYGNLIGVEEVESVKNYVFITGVDTNGSMITNKTADMNALFLDGTSAVIQVNTSKSTSGLISDNALLNTWCTYTVANDGVYTLTQVPSTDNGHDENIPQPGVANAKNTGKLAQYHESFASDKNIDTKNITLSGKGTTGAFSNVYGNANTVYLTAELGNITANKVEYGTIKGVDSVVTGVDNASLKVWKQGTQGDGTDHLTTGRTGAQAQYKKVNPADGNYAQGVYTLYNEKGIVIAAVVVGEDNGASKNLVYVHTSTLEREAYNSSSSRSSDGQWTWTRFVVQDGKKVELTEVGDSSSYLEKMVQYRWYQVKLNAKGEVIGAYRMPGAATTAGMDETLEVASLTPFVYTNATTWTKDAEITSDVDHLGEAIKDGKSTMLFWSPSIKDKLSLDGRTLYVKTSTKSGFLVREDVEVVLQQWDKNKKETYIETYTGADSLGNVIDEINERYKDKTYVYQVCAVLENGGVASSVLIWDDNNNYVGPSGSATGLPSDGVYGYEVSTATAKNADKMEELFMEHDVIVVANEGRTFTDDIFVPSNKTLVFKGSVDTSSTGDLEFGNSNAKLLVDGTLKFDEDIPASATVRVTDMITTDNQDIRGIVTVDEDLTINGAKKVLVASTSTVTVGRYLLSDNNNTLLQIAGTMYVNNKQLVEGSTVSVTGKLTIQVTSTNSLHLVGGKGTGTDVAIIVGDKTRESNNGRVVMSGGEIKGTYIDWNVSRVSQTITGLTGTAVLNANSQITGMVTFAPTALYAPVGATITFATSTSADPVTSKVDFVNMSTGSKVNVSGQTVTFGSAVGTAPTVTVGTAGSTVTGDVATSGGVSLSGGTQPNTVTENVIVKTENSGSTTTNSLAIGSSYIIYNKASWEKAKADGVRGLGKKADADGTETTTDAVRFEDLSAHAISTFPWLYVEVLNPDGKTGDITPTVTVGNTTFTGDTIENADNTLSTANPNSWYHWEMQKNVDGGTACALKTDTAIVGTYSFGFTYGSETVEAKTVGTLTRAQLDECETLKEKEATNGTKYGDLSDLVAEGGNIKLLNDVTMTNLEDNGITVGSDKTVTLDLNGHDITGSIKTSGKALIDVAGTLTVNANGGSITATQGADNARFAYAVAVEKDGKATFNNASIEGIGTIYVKGDTGTTRTTALTLNNCDVKSTDSHCSAILTNGTAKSATTITVNGGTIESEGGGIFLTAGNVKCIVTGADITAASAGIAMKSSELTITGGSIITRNPKADGAETSGNGFKTDSSAIFLDCNTAYTAGMKLTIDGTKLESYAYGISIVGTQTATVAVDGADFTGCVSGALKKAEGTNVTVTAGEDNKVGSGDNSLTTVVTPAPENNEEDQNP